MAFDMNNLVVYDPSRRARETAVGAYVDPVEGAWKDVCPDIFHIQKCGHSVYMLQRRNGVRAYTERLVAERIRY